MVREVCLRAWQAILLIAHAVPEVQDADKLTSVGIARTGLEVQKTKLLPAGELKDDSQVLSVTFGDSRLVTGVSGMLEVYEDAWPPSLDWSMHVHGDIESISAENGLVVVAHENHISVFELEASEKLQAIHDDGPQVVALSADGKVLVVGGKDGQMRIFTPSSKTDQFEQTRSHILGADPVLAVAFGANETLISLCAGAPHMYDLQSHEMVWEAEKDPFDELTALAMAPNGCWFATGASSGALQGYLLGRCISDDEKVPGFSARFTWQTDDAAVSALAFSPDSQFLVVATSRNLRLHPLDASWSPPRTTGFFLQDAPVIMPLDFAPRSLAFSGDSCRLAAATEDGPVQLFKSSLKKCHTVKPASTTTASTEVSTSASTSPSTEIPGTTEISTSQPASSEATTTQSGAHPSHHRPNADSDSSAMVIVVIVGLIMVTVMASGFWMWFSEARQVTRSGGGGVEMSQYVPPSV